MNASQTALAEVVRTIVRLVVSDQPRERDRGADEVTDVLGSLAPDNIVMLARLLVFARLNETDQSCQESQLNALAALHSRIALTADVTEPLRALEPLPGPQREHLDEILEP